MKIFGVRCLEGEDGSKKNEQKEQKPRKNRGSVDRGKISFISELPNTYRSNTLVPTLTSQEGRNITVMERKRNPFTLRGFEKQK